MNNKGFAVSGILYTIFMIFLVTISIMLFNLQNRKTILDELKIDAVNAVESDNNYEYLLSEINSLKAQIGTNSISGIGDGTITGAISNLQNVETADISLTSNVTKIGNSSALKSGNQKRYIMNFRLNVTDIGATGVQIATIPEGFRPQSWFVKWISLGEANVLLFISPDGSVELKYAKATLNTSSWHYIDETIIDG